MRSPPFAAASLVAASLAIAGVTALASPPLDSLRRYDLTRRNGDHGHHMKNAQPILELNETEILLTHAPTPPSYYTIDWEGEGDSTEARHPGFMLGHIVFMTLAFFGALPIAIILRSLRHPAHGLAMISFYAFSGLGISSSAVYRKLTPDMYEGSVHGQHGYTVLLGAILLSAIDIIQTCRRVVLFIRSDNKTFKSFWQRMVLNQDPGSPNFQEPEYTGLIVDDPEDLEYSKAQHREDDSNTPTDEWANDVRQHRRFSSNVSERTIFGHQSRSHSDDTLNDHKLGKLAPNRAWASWIGGKVFDVMERTIVAAGWGTLVSGIVVYTGGCRQGYINGCLAHLIKGGIFWFYGLLTFARFLGAFADRGWAWNRTPGGHRYSAEFTESFVIFLYGVTNTWMERFGAKAGDPYTTKQIQHISIAVMFWFAGLLGIGIESRRVRRWLASSTFASVSTSADLHQDAISEPPSYLASFNPFPALVIGVTGAAMAAHFQTYLFQVQIHELWGNLLLGFSVLRCLTYFFMWLSPPKSILPSRPPTEALGSFFLACGGLVFMFSTEEVTIAAMRRGRDDVMMFLNVSVAITCLAFCWTFLVVGLKGYLKSRRHTNITYRSATTSSTP